LASSVSHLLAAQSEFRPSRKRRKACLPLAGSRRRHEHFRSALPFLPDRLARDQSIEKASGHRPDAIAASASLGLRIQGQPSAIKFDAVFSAATAGPPWTFRLFLPARTIPCFQVQRCCHSRALAQRRWCREAGSSSTELGTDPRMRTAAQAWPATGVRGQAGLSCQAIEAKAT